MRSSDLYFVSCLVLTSGSQETTRIRIPVSNEKVASGFEIQEQEMLEPHLLLHHLFTTTGIQVRESDVRQFWRHVRHTSPQVGYVESPASDSHIPVAVYGDAAKLSTAGGKMIGIFLSLPLWRPYSTRCGCWCLWALEEHKLYRHVTLNKVYRRIAYSLNIAFKGLDPDGSLLANG